MFEPPDNSATDTGSAIDFAASEGLTFAAASLDGAREDDALTGIGMTDHDPDGE